MCDTTYYDPWKEPRRYDLRPNYRCGSAIEEMERCADGEWVRWEDIEIALASERLDSDKRVADLSAENAALRDNNRAVKALCDERVAALLALESSLLALQQQMTDFRHELTEFQRGTTKPRGKSEAARAEVAGCQGTLAVVLSRFDAKLAAHLTGGPA